MTLAPEQHHQDCDYRNSHAARETEALFNLPERTELHACNLACELNHCACGERVRKHDTCWACA